MTSVRKPWGITTPAAQQPSAIEVESEFNWTDGGGGGPLPSRTTPPLRASIETTRAGEWARPALVDLGRGELVRASSLFSLLILTVGRELILKRLSPGRPIFTRAQPPSGGLRCSGRQACEGGRSRVSGVSEVGHVPKLIMVGKRREARSLTGDNSSARAATGRLSRRRGDDVRHRPCRGQHPDERAWPPRRQWVEPLPSRSTRL